MNGTIDDRYFEWLYGLIGAVRNRNPARSYWSLSRRLYTKEFIWIVPNDDNRIEDGRDLRYEFVDEQGTDGANANWFDLGCSMLEMLIALSRRAAFESDKLPGDWFWLFMKNLDLDQYTDNRYSMLVAQEIDNVLDCVIQRTYSSDGSGGLFPLRDPAEDQRQVELWYQLAAYLLEDSSL